MGSLPRILTVDPMGTIPQVVRGAIELMDRLVIQVDTPGGDEAIEEVKRGGYNLVISAWNPDRHRQMKGWELAAKVKRESESTAIIIVADESDPAMDEETLDNSPFVYLKRPMDPAQFLRVLEAGLDGKDLKEAMQAPVAAMGSGAMAVDDMGPVPGLNLDHAQTTLETLLADLGAMAIILSSRAGDVLLEVGAVGYLDRVELTKAVLPTIQSNISMKEIVGGNASALQFYDGADYDVFVLSVGLHHFICVAFDGEGGSRQFGGVNRYGRRAAEDLIAVLGANAWIIDKPRVQEPEVRRKSELRTTAAPAPEPEEELVLESASFGDTEPEPEAPKMEAIDESMFNVDDLFGDLSDGDMSLFDDLEALEDIAKEDESARKGTLGWDDAIKIGLIQGGSNE